MLRKSQTRRKFKTTISYVEKVLLMRNDTVNKAYSK